MGRVAAARGSPHHAPSRSPPPLLGGCGAGSYTPYYKYIIMFTNLTDVCMYGSIGRVVNVGIVVNMDNLGCVLSYISGS